MADLIDAVETLIRSIWSDEDHHGGLLSRDTIRHADELRALLVLERRQRGIPPPAELDMPRQPRGAL